MNLENDYLNALTRSIEILKNEERNAKSSGEKLRIRNNLEELRQMRDELLGDVENEL